MKQTRMTVFGPITVTEENGTLTGLQFGGGFENGERSEVIDETFSQLDAYFAGRLREFYLPLAPKGTPFMLGVWAELLKIPYGKTCSYGGIANAIGKPGAMRAVGMANNRNPIAIVIPCHRVIGADGKLVGYGAGLPIKEKLLELEKVYAGM